MTGLTITALSFLRGDEKATVQLTLVNLQRQIVSGLTAGAVRG